MAAQRQFVDHIVGIERMNNSANGNPRFMLKFKESGSFPTAVDASVAYGIENPEYKGVPVRVTLERGQVTYVTPNINEQ